MTIIDVKVERRVAVVTGAGSGLGKAFAWALYDAGFSIVGIGRSYQRLSDALLGIDPDRLLLMESDVSNEAAVALAFQLIVEEWGRVDVLVNNAGTFGPTGQLSDVDLAEVRATFETNCMGSFICAREAMRVMRQQEPSGGRIINNGSVSAQVPRPLSAAYAMSKHAITGLTKSIALDGRADGIACGQIDIGNAATAMVEPIGSGALQADGSILQEPTFDAREAARAVVYMATLPPEANVLFMTLTATSMPLVGRG